MNKVFDIKDYLLSLHDSIESSNTGESIKKIMTEYCESWNTGDFAKCKSLFDSRATFTDPKNSNTLSGIDEIFGFWLSSNEIPGSIKTQIHSTVACGDNGILDFTVSFHNPDETVVNLRVREVFSFNVAGKVISVEAYWDTESIT